MQKSLITTLLIVGIVAVVLSMIAIIYMVTSFRRRTIVLKKIDYLVEDITYKSELLNSPVETIAKMANYIDAFELIAKNNMKTATKIIARNKDDIYKIINRIKIAAMGDDTKQKQKKSPKKRTSKGGK